MLCASLCRNAGQNVMCVFCGRGVGEPWAHLRQLPQAVDQ